MGITGAPGTGKSTLTDGLIRQARASGTEVGVLAVDPSSPFSGGAILGDRVRMQEHATDPGVFVRSMATRGHVGGLSLATPQAIRVLDACGVPLVLVETVGVGQVEVDVAGAADTAVVVVTPGWGDAVQANKAGLLELANLFVVNMADRPGAREAERDLADMLDMDRQARGWRPPILRTVASTGDGLAELWAAIGRHRSFLEDSGLLAERRARRVVDELREIVVRSLERQAVERCSGPGFQQLAADLLERRIDPYSAAAALLEP